MKNTSKLVALSLLIMTMAAVSCVKPRVSSPDGKIKVELKLDKDGNPMYCVSVGNDIVMDSSLLGFQFKDSTLFKSGFLIEGVSRCSKDTVWEQVWGESRFVADKHNELLILREALRSPV